MFKTHTLGGRTLLGLLLWLSSTGVAVAQCPWPEQLDEIENGAVLTEAMLNGRFEALKACFDTRPAMPADCDAGQLLVSDGAGGFNCGPSLDSLVEDRVTAALAACEVGQVVEVGPGGTLRCGPARTPQLLGDEVVVIRLDIDPGAGPDACPDDEDAALACFGNGAEALAWLRGYRVGPGGAVSIDYRVGRWEAHPALEIDHPDSDRISINGPDPEVGAATLAFESKGVVVKAGRRAKLTNLRLHGADDEVGLKAEPLSHVLVEGLAIHGFEVGLRASKNAVVSSADGQPLQVTQSGENAYYCELGAVIDAPAAVLGGSFGVRSTQGGIVRISRLEPGLPRPSIQGAAVGMAADSGAILIADGYSVNATGTAISAAESAVIVANGVSIEAPRTAVVAETNSTVALKSVRINQGRAAGLEHGIQAFNGSVVNASGGSIYNATGNGVQAGSSSLVRLGPINGTDATVQDCGTGVLASEESLVAAAGADIRDCTTGVAATTGAFVTGGLTDDRGNETPAVGELPGPGFYGPF